MDVQHRVCARPAQAPVDAVVLGLALRPYLDTGAPLRHYSNRGAYLRPRIRYA